MADTISKSDAYKMLISGGTFAFKDNREMGFMLKFIRISPEAWNTLEMPLREVLADLGIKRREALEYSPSNKTLTIRLIQPRIGGNTDTGALQEYYGIESD